MAHALMVTKKGTLGTWAVYLNDDSPREEGALVRTTGPLAGSVSSWPELNALADKHQVEDHQIYGDGLAEMERELGPRP
jgi:hypothetical protein